ncbi:MAG TPA: DNA topoisomerase IV subunit A [Tepidisphaeraceae bacterium]|nr:DNA topoisomerase IV subunit A [Tepidisphaeraceae bacterium]
MATKAASKTKKHAETSKKLEALAQVVIKSAKAKEDPGIEIPTRALSNAMFDEKKKIIMMGDNKQMRNFFNLSQAKKFMQTMLVASGCKDLADQGKSTSIRDMYYHTKHTIEGTRENTFDDQSESDPIIEDLEVAIESLREELGLFAENRGAMAGAMTLVDAGDTIDLTKVGSGGWAVPSIVEDDIIQFKKCTADFILLIEKGAVWNRFNQDRFWEDHNCLIVHGGGQPPRGVRRLMYRMHHELNLPVYVLTDNDPWGYYIYSVVKQGSINLAFESQRMAIPKARFIGMSSFDVDRFGISKTVTIAMKDEDVRRAKEIMNYPWFKAKKDWQKEIEHMLKTGVKLELEALSSKDFSFITETYLPEKLKKKQWLD